MPSSPCTPRHSRQSSALDSLPGSPEQRRLSKTSVQGLRRDDTLDLNTLGGGGQGTHNGMGNLADELADAFSDSESDDQYDDDAAQSRKSGDAADGTRFSDSLGAPVDSSRLSPQRHEVSRTGGQYDGSDYGSESDMDGSGLTLSLVNQMGTVESLARRGTENYGGPDEDVFKRVTNSLRDLGSQSIVEGGASRLITAHSALTTHLNHQTRQLHSLTFSLLSPLAPPPDPEALDSLMPVLASLTDDMPRPFTSALSALGALHSLTADLVMTINYLADNLSMSRQTTTTASRRLRSTRELVAEMRREDELRDEGERWLTRGNWGERLEKRECATVCGDVLGGFEEVCNGWRERLLMQAGSEA